MVARMVVVERAIRGEVMAAGGIVYAEEWEIRSRERVKAAKALAAKRLWADAFDLAGYAVEFALK